MTRPHSPYEAGGYSTINMTNHSSSPDSTEPAPVSDKQGTSDSNPDSLPNHSEPCSGKEDEIVSDIPQISVVTVLMPPSPGNDSNIVVVDKAGGSGAGPADDEHCCTGPELNSTPVDGPSNNEIESSADVRLNLVPTDSTAIASSTVVHPSAVPDDDPPAAVVFLNLKSEECPICYDEYTLDDPPVDIECGHQLHFQCAEEWLQRSNKCPICWKRLMYTDPNLRKQTESTGIDWNAMKKTSYVTTETPTLQPQPAQASSMDLVQRLELWRSMMEDRLQGERLRALARSQRSVSMRTRRPVQNVEGPSSESRARRNSSAQEDGNFWTKTRQKFKDTMEHAGKKFQAFASGLFSPSRSEEAGPSDAVVVDIDNRDTQSTRSNQTARQHGVASSPSRLGPASSSPTIPR